MSRKYAELALALGVSSAAAASAVGGNSINRLSIPVQHPVFDLSSVIFPLAV